jgi:hypothetical protein
MQSSCWKTGVCVVLDDASRKILSGGEFSNATAEHSVLLLKEALEHADQAII